MSNAVLYVNTPTYTGGAEISLLSLMRHLDPERYVPLLVTSGEGELANAARGHEIRVLVQEFPWFRRRYPWRYAASIARLIRIIRTRSIALVHTNCDHSLRYVMWACQVCRVPYVSHVRDFVRSWFQPSNLSALNKAAAVIANSQAVAAACTKAGTDPRLVRVIYNPIELSPYRLVANIDRQRMRFELALPSDAFLVGLVGQFHPVKGHVELVNAARLVRDTVPDALFLVAGEAFDTETNAFKDRLMQEVFESGLSERFRFLGFRSDIPQLMRAMDVLAVPSWTESFGRVVVEGLAAGCAVIATSVGGIPEIITDESSGLLIKPRDAKELAAAIIRLAEDHTLRCQLQSAGPLAAERFDAHLRSDEIQALYDEIIWHNRR